LQALRAELTLASPLQKLRAEHFIESRNCHDIESLREARIFSSDGDITESELDSDDNEGDCQPTNIMCLSHDAAVELRGHHLKDSLPRVEGDCSPSDLLEGSQHPEIPNDCAICLSSYEEGDMVVGSSNPMCMHVFHSGCVEAWLLRRRGRPDDFLRCPCCRQIFLLRQEEGVADDVDLEAGKH
jgi:hypothetical protein